MQTALQPSDFTTETWKRVALGVESRMAELMAQVCNPNTPFEQTQVIRGRIAECKRLLALALPAPTTEPGQDSRLRRAEPSDDDGEIY